MFWQLKYCRKELKMTDEWKNAKEAAAGGGETWNREDTIEGLYVRKRTNIGANDSNMYVLQVKDGEVGVWGSTVLDTKFEEIPVGSKVRIEPLGKVKSEKTGRSYIDFKVLYIPSAKAQVDEVFTEEDMPADWLKG